MKDGLTPFSFMQALDSFKQNTSHLNDEGNNNISLSQRADYENKLRCSDVIVMHPSKLKRIFKTK